MNVGTIVPVTDQHPPVGGPEEPTAPGPTATPPPYSPPPAPPVPPAPPAWPSPDAGEPTAAQPPVAPAPPYGAPQYGTPQYGAPQYGAPPYGAPQYATPPAPEAPAGGRQRRTGLIVGLLVVAVLVIGGIVGIALLAGGGSDLTITVDTCSIAADGSLRAAGTVGGPDGTSVTVEVDFVDSATGADVDSGSTSLDLGSGGSWEVTGSAGDEVQGVDCNATADD